MPFKTESVSLYDKVDVRETMESKSSLSYPLDMSETRYMASFRINKLFDGSQGKLSKMATPSSPSNPSVEYNRETTKHILLYQTPVNVSYSQNWAKQEGIYGNYGTFEEVGNLSSIGLLKDQLVTYAKTAVGGVGKAAWGGDMGAKTGVAINPFLGVAYESPSLRTLSIPYVFEPRSAKEAQAVINIIDAFKYHSAPAYMDLREGVKSDMIKSGIEAASLDQALLKAPNVFEISFLDTETNGRNKSLFKFGPAVCMDVVCNYASNGIWRAFDNGLPVSVELTLTFQEMEIVTREKIVRGW